MNTKWTWIVGLVIVLLSIFVSAFFFPILPERIASHWNAAGQADGFTSRFQGAAMLPIVIVGFFLLLMALPAIDPLKKNIELFRLQYNAAIVMLTGFFFYLHLVTLILNTGLQIPITIFLAPAIGLVYYLLGVFLKSAKPNWTFGIRTPWTLSNETVWKKTHALGSLLFRAAGVIVALSVFLPAWVVPIMLAVILLATAILVVYSYTEFRREAKS